MGMLEIVWGLALALALWLVGFVFITNPDSSRSSSNNSRSSNINNNNSNNNSNNNNNNNNNSNNNNSSNNSSNNNTSSCTSFERKRGNTNHRRSLINERKEKKSANIACGQKKKKTVHFHEPATTTRVIIFNKYRPIVLGEDTAETLSGEKRLATDIVAVCKAARIDNHSPFGAEMREFAPRALPQEVRTDGSRCVFAEAKGGRKRAIVTWHDGVDSGKRHRFREPPSTKTPGAAVPEVLSS